jgi:hypothetical protein
MQWGSLPQQGAIAAWGAPSIIRSLQSGITNAAVPTVTATILPVVPENCLLIYQGITSQYSSGLYLSGRVELTNATTISILGAGNAGALINLAWTVIEFVPGLIKSLQAGVIDLGAAVSATATISPVNPDRCVLLWMGLITAQPDTNGAAIWTRLAITNPTTITATRSLSSNATSSPWRLVEFF